MVDTRLITSPGVYYDLSFTEYRAQRDWLSVSDLNCFAQSDLTFEWRVLKGNRKEASKAQNIGSAVHCGFLEPELFDSQFTSIDEALNTTAGKNKKKELEAKTPGLTVMNKGDMEVVSGCVDALKANPLSSKLISKGRAEVSFFWICPKTGLKLKGRADWLDEEGGICPDLKTTKDALKFESSIAEFGYHRQASHYLDGLQVLLGRMFKWCWIAVGTEDPYLVKVWEPELGDLKIGHDELLSFKQRLVECRKTSRYEGPAPVMHKASLPSWYKARHLSRVIL